VEDASRREGLKETKRNLGDRAGEIVGREWRGEMRAGGERSTASYPKKSSASSVSDGGK
jgi:hypothetical protein